MTILFVTSNPISPRKCVRFQQYAYTFQANSDGEAEVTFLNSSPTEVVCKESDPEQNAKGIYTKMCGSLAVFIDNVEVREIVDCGEGASQ